MCSHSSRGATTNSGLSETLALMEFAMKQWVSTALILFGTSFVHYTRAGSGDILAINAPQAQFASVTQITPTATNHCSTPLPAFVRTNPLARWHPERTSERR